MHGMCVEKNMVQLHLNTRLYTENQIVQESIFTALIQLMQKEFHNITITEITEKAGVSRMSYYRNYSSKEDILIKYLDRILMNI